VGAREIIYWYRERRPQLLSGQIRPTGTGQEISRTPSDYEREGEQVSISCELQELEEVMAKAGVLLTGNAYDTAQDYLQDNCACATYRYLLEGVSK
jgi:hypothetical protein